MSSPSHRESAMLVTIAVAVCTAINEMAEAIRQQGEKFLASEMEVDEFVHNLAVTCIESIMQSEVTLSEVLMTYSPALALEFARIRSEDPSGKASEQMQASILNLQFRNS